MGARVYGVGARVYGSLVILVSAQVLLVLTLGLWTSDLGLTIIIIIRFIISTIDPKRQSLLVTKDFLMLFSALNNPCLAFSAYLVLMKLHTFCHDILKFHISFFSLFSCHEG